MKAHLCTPFFRAAVLLLLCLAYRLWAFLLAPHNDDIQIIHMLTGGGEGAEAFSAFNNIVLGWGIQQLSTLFPGITWYTLLLFTLSAFCCLILNILSEQALAGRKQKSPYNSLVSLSFRGMLLYINLECLLFTQYTFVAILCGCTATILFGCAALSPGNQIPLSRFAAISLFCCTYVLRPDAIFAPMFLIVAIWTSSLFKNKSLMLPKGAALILLLSTIGIVTCLTIQQRAFAYHPEWKETALSIKSRVNIQDYPDNSGIDKSKLYKKAGVSPEQLKIFKTFTYTPSLSELETIRKAESIHRQNRKGLMGLEAAGHAGLLEFKPKSLLAPFRSLSAMTQLIPIGLMGLLFLLSLTRKSLRDNLPMLIGSALYLFTLMLVGRYTDRVAEPVLLACPVWLMLHLPATCPRFDKAGRILRWGMYTFTIVCILVSLRHKRPEPAPVHPLPWELCQANPDKLYITTNMQGCGLYPTGIQGLTQEYIKSSNIVPIADGWFFYTPAYKALLKARGISNPYLELHKPQTRIITFTRYEAEPILQQLNEVYRHHTGQSLHFSPDGQCGEFIFWKASIAPNANTDTTSATETPPHSRIKAKK